jgi:hypothetical protein
MKQIAVLSGLILAVGIVAAFASDASEWIMKPNHGYVIDQGGHVKIVDLKTDDAMTARAQEVPNGATFFMNEGRVMMYFDRGTPAGFFDR